MSFVATIQANIDEFTRNLDRAQARIDAFADNVGSKIAKIGSTFQAIGGAISIGVTAPLTAAGVAAYNFAADFEDAMGATDQIFKEASESTKEWANSLPTYYGIAEKEALEYSNMMGSMLQNIGNLTEQEASKQSAKLIELAGDLTAMYGGTTQDAVRALTGALKGNNTMLDNYGMAANDALVKAKALSMGLVEQGKEMTLSAKQAATLALIYEQSGAAQGQAAREADGASGSMRAFRTEITNLTTELGSHLLPVITPLINHLKGIIEGFRSMNPETQKMIVTIGAAVAALGPFLVALGSIMKLAPLVGTAFSVMTGPIGIAVAAIAAAAILIVKNWASIVAYFTKGDGSKFWKSISANAQYLWEKLKQVFTFIKDSIIYTWEQIDTNVIAIVRNSFSTILSTIEGVFNIVTGVVKTFAALMRGDFSGALEHIRTLFKNVFYNILDIAKNTLSTVGNLLAVVLKAVGADGLADSLTTFSNSIKPTVTETKALSEATGKVSEATKSYTDKVKEVVPETEKAKKATRDYKAELVDLFAEFGYYDSQIQSITNKFNGFRDMAAKAGASAKEFGRIAREELGEKLNTALNQFDLKETKPKIAFDLSLNIDEQAISNQMHSALEIVNDKYAEVRSSFESLTLELSNSIGQGVSDIASSIGNALATGENVFTAIGNSLIKGLGSLAKSIGEQMIAFGIAGIALKKLMMNPYLAVAAGAALVALGSIASSSVGSQTSNYTGGYASSGGSYQNNNNDYSALRGALYNNDKQVVELKLRNGDLVGAIDYSNNRNTRLK